MQKFFNSVKIWVPLSGWEFNFVNYVLDIAGMQLLFIKLIKKFENVFDETKLIKKQKKVLIWCKYIVNLIRPTEV